MFRYVFGMRNMGGNNKASITWIIFDYYYYSRVPLPFQATELVLHFSYIFCKDGCHLLIGLSFWNKISHLNCNWTEIALCFCINDSYLWYAMNFKSISVYKCYFNFYDLNNRTFRIKDFIVCILLLSAWKLLKPKVKIPVWAVLLHAVLCHHHHAVRWSVKEVIEGQECHIIAIGFYFMGWVWWLKYNLLWCTHNDVDIKRVQVQLQTYKPPQQ